MSDKRIKKITVNNTEISYVEAGQGEPVVFVHGSLSDFRTWGRQIIFFSRCYRALAYSRRYHYPNERPENGTVYSVDQHADDLIGFLDGLGLDKVKLVGSSYGAYVSLVAAKRRPDRVVSLVIGEPPIFSVLRQDDSGGASILEAFLRTIWHPSQEYFQEGNTEAGVRLFYEGITAPGAYDLLPRAVRTGMLQNAAPMKAESSARTVFPPFTKTDAARVTMPVLLLTGSASPAIFHRITDQLERMLPNRERLTVPHASHSMHTDNPENYNDVVSKFMQCPR